MSCIYAIKHIISEFVYIGCTMGSTTKRMREHRSLLNAGKHRSVLLQHDWARDGEAVFVLLELEQLLPGASVAEKRAAELAWMETHRAKLYNHTQTSFAPTKEHQARIQVMGAAVEGRKHSPEANEKRRLAQLGKPKGHGAKISETKRRLGQRPSLEAAKQGGIATCKARWGGSK